MIHAMHVEHSFSDLLLKAMPERSMRIQADLVDLRIVKKSEAAN
jgi:hypothetical protein